ncbi:MAG: GxxExxY protein [Candidatus Kapaibacterium sp.]
MAALDARFEATDLTGKIIGCAMKVHTSLGSGFQEMVYQRALEIEFQDSGMSFVREYELPIQYKQKRIGGRRVDFLVAERIPVELKAIVTLENMLLAQAMNYLEAYNLKTGMLINFGSPRLQYHRLTNKKFRSAE